MKILSLFSVLFCLLWVQLCFSIQHYSHTPLLDKCSPAQLGERQEVLLFWLQKADHKTEMFISNWLQLNRLHNHTMCSFANTKLLLCYTKNQINQVNLTALYPEHVIASRTHRSWFWMYKIQASASIWMHGSCFWTHKIKALAFNWWILKIDFKFGKWNTSECFQINFENVFKYKSDAGTAEETSFRHHWLVHFDPHTLASSAVVVYNSKKKQLFNIAFFWKATLRASSIS